MTLLVINRVKELGQEVLHLHEEMEKWRKEPLNAMQRTQMAVRLQSCLQEQFRWLNALEELLEKQEGG